VATDAKSGALPDCSGVLQHWRLFRFHADGLGIAVNSAPGVTYGTMTGAAPIAFSVADSTTLSPRVQSWQFAPGWTCVHRRSGSGRGSQVKFMTVGRQTDVNGVALGNAVSLVLGSGAVVATDPGGAVTLGAGSGGTIDVLAPSPPGRKNLRQGHAAIHR